MDADLPSHVNYWITSVSKHDCFFNVGTEFGSRERIGAIKILLMGHSEVLRKMLDKTESVLAETGDIRIPDTDPETFRNFLKCIYGGTEMLVRKLSFVECLNLLYLCEKYLVIEAKQKISTFILEVHQPLSVQNVFDCLLHLGCLENKNLTDAISKIIQSNTALITENEQFLLIDVNALMFIANQEHLSIREIDLWKAVLAWCQNKVKEDPEKCIKSYVKKVISSIRFCTMSSSEFCSFVVPSDVLTNAQVSKICKSIGTATVQDIKGINNEIVSRHQKSKSEMVIFYTLNQISTFNTKVFSPQLEMNGFKWNIYLDNFKSDTEDTKWLGFFLQCEPVAAVPSSWECCASAELSLVNHGGRPDKRHSFTNHSFNNNAIDWGYRHFYVMKELVLPEQGFVKNDCIEVKVKVEIKSQ